MSVKSTSAATALVARPATAKFVIRQVSSGTSFLLMESGDKVLMESGDKIVLEK